MPTAPDRKPTRARRVLRQLPHPCANCARVVFGRNSTKTYCSDLCSQAASFVRYYSEINADGRIEEGDRRDAAMMKLAHIASGGYKATERRLSKDVREAVTRRANGVCKFCGEPAKEIDHISGSSPELSNLQLLCHSCHLAKSQSRLMPATAEVASAVHDRLIRRCLQSVPQQPCDRMDWMDGCWRLGAELQSKKMIKTWKLWVERDGSLPLTASVASNGFPESLDVWSWYAGSQGRRKINGRTPSPWE